MAERLYTLEIKYNNRFGRIHFSGESSIAGEAKFAEARKKIPDIGEASASFEEFRVNILEHIKECEFNQVKS